MRFPIEFHREGLYVNMPRGGFLLFTWALLVAIVLLALILILIGRGIVLGP